MRAVLSAALALALLGCANASPPPHAGWGREYPTCADRPVASEGCADLLMT